jgi:hypothetical protein
LVCAYLFLLYCHAVPLTTALEFDCFWDSIITKVPSLTSNSQCLSFWVLRFQECATKPSLLCNIFLKLGCATFPALLVLKVLWLSKIFRDLIWRLFFLHLDFDRKCTESVDHLTIMDTLIILTLQF